MFIVYLMTKSNNIEKIIFCVICPLRRKLKLGLRLTPDQPPEQTVPNPAEGTTYTRQIPPFRIGAAREPCPWDLCRLCKQTGHWRPGDATVHSTIDKDSKPMVSPALQQISESSNVLDNF